MVTWENGTLKTKGYVTINNMNYSINMPEYSGKTPITAENLNLMQQISSDSTIIESDTTITNGYEVTLPVYYQVGNNSLELRLNSEVLILATDDSDGHYKEIGTDGELSNTIAFYRTDDDGDWTLDEDVTLTAIVKGVEQE